MSKDRFEIDCTGGILDLQDTKNMYCLNDSEICELLNKQSKQIADLEAKLAESEKELKVIDEDRQFKAEMWTKFADKCKDLKQQLAEKDDEITQRLVIQERDYNQDKISFAVEQIQELKKFTEKEIKECNKLLQEEFEDNYYIQSVNARQSMCYEFNREIDNQIKQLEEMK